jgi:hypothetical protein
VLSHKVPWLEDFPDSIEIVDGHTVRSVILPYGDPSSLTPD